ncbi:MAG TPA: mechanosensitive ion channel domain-containing protein [Mucilaginibacter sp.]|jgi:small-conductance mechanosensitive channel
MSRFHCIFLTLLIAAFSATAQKPVEDKGAPVIIDQDTVLIFYTGYGTITAKERAAIVHKRISNVVSRLDFNPDSLILKNDSTISSISYKSQLLFTVNNKDASFSELDRPQLAASYLAVLKKKLGNVFENNSVKQTIINILQATSVVIVLLLLIWGLNRLFKRLKFKLIKSWEVRAAQLAEKGAPISYANQLLPVVTKLLGIGKLIIILLFIYLALTVAFLIFPWTKPIATELLSYIIDPAKGILLGIIHYVPNLLTITVIYLATRYLVRLVRFIANEVGHGSVVITGFYPEWAIPTYNIVRVLLYAFMFVVIFPYLPGSQSDVFKGVTVFLGILVSLGSSSAISNMVAGLVITYMRPFKIGDLVKVGETMGFVVEKNLLVTKICTAKNEDITVPNATILGGVTTNYSSLSQDKGLILHTSITIGYDAPWRTIHELLISAALATDGILKDPKPFVLQSQLNDFNVTYQINAYTSSNKVLLLYSLLHQNIQDKFNEAGMEIMSPHFTSLRDGNAIQIPDDYIGEAYKKPGFKVEKEK